MARPGRTGTQLISPDMGNAGSVDRLWDEKRSRFRVGARPAYLIQMQRILLGARGFAKWRSLSRSNCLLNGCLVFI